MIALQIAVKLVTLAGAVAQTAGVLTFFTLETLAPYRWTLILGGTFVIAVSEGVSYLLTRKMASLPIDDR